MKVSKKQILEWTENPVTIKLRDLVNNEIKEIAETPSADCLHYGDPNRTQEELVKQDVLAFVFVLMHEALDGDWDYFQEIEDEE